MENKKQEVCPDCGCVEGEKYSDSLNCCSECGQIMEDARRSSFEVVTRPVISWMNDNCHPHTTVIITGMSAELMEGVVGFTTEDYLKD